MNIWIKLGDYLRLSFVQYAIIVSILTALCAALIGVSLVLKRYSFIGDGLSHVAFGGMAVAAVLNLTNEVWLVMPLTVVIAVCLLGRGRNAKIKGDAAIAMLSVGALALGYFLMNVFSVSSNIAGDVCTSLFGSISILTLQTADVIVSVIMAVLVIALFILFYNKIFGVTFDPVFVSATGGSARVYEVFIAVAVGIVITLSMRLVGSLLTAALVIFPALSAMRVFKTFRGVVICSAAVSVFCALLGIFICILFETPFGATIVLMDIFVFIVFCALSRIFRK